MERMKKLGKMLAAVLGAIFMPILIWVGLGVALKQRAAEKAARQPATAPVEVAGAAQPRTARRVAATFGKMLLAVLGAIFMPILIWVGLGVAVNYQLRERSARKTTVPTLGEILAQAEQEPAPQADVRTVLVVDDEEIIRESLKEWLSSHGYEVTTAEDGAQALKMMREKNFGVTILDLKLPDKDGIQVLTEAREYKPDLKSIFITAYPTVDAAAKARKLGASDFIPKPFEPEQLEKSIEKVLTAA
jgi:CheY-like chemotaxis protein